MLKKRTIAIFVCCIYLFGIPAQAAPALNLTPPTQMVPISAIQSYPVLRGIEVDPEDPFHLKFIIDNHNQKVSKEEISTLIKYFLAGLTLSEEGLWVNLSPYEKDNIAPLALSQTDLGKELLSQDYTLKQLTSSLTYPESDTGKAYWNKVYQKTYQLKKTTNIPIDTYNKVWIVPKQAKVYETGNKAFITDATLSALAEEDYLALKQNNQPSVGNGHARSLHKLSSQIMQDTLLLHIEQDINQGKNFASLRQAYHSLILATWFKQKLKDSVYQYYLNQDKIKGIGLSDPQTKDKIYQQYLSAYKQGVYNYIKKDREPYTNRPIKRQYYSGGMQFAVAKAMMPASSSAASSALMRAERNGTTMVSVRLAASSASRTDQIKEAIALLDWLREPSQKFSQGRPADYDIKYDQLKARLAALGIDSGAQDKELAYILYQLPRKNSAQVLDEALESHTVKSNDSPGEASSAVTYEDVRQANQIHSAAAERYLESSRIYGRDDKRTKAANADKKRARKELVRVREEFEKSNPASASSSAEKMTTEKALRKPANLNRKGDEYKADSNIAENWLGLLRSPFDSWTEPSGFIKARKQGELSKKDRYVGGRIWKEVFDRNQESLSGISIAETLANYHDVTLEEATGEAIIRALIIAGVLEWKEGDPDIWMFWPDENDILHIIHTNIVKGRNDGSVFRALALDLSLKIPEADAIKLSDELFQAEPKDIKNLVVAALAKQTAVSRDSASSTVTLTEDSPEIGEAAKYIHAAIGYQSEDVLVSIRMDTAHKALNGKFHAVIWATYDAFQRKRPIEQDVKRELIDRLRNEGAFDASASSAVTRGGIDLDTIGAVGATRRVAPTAGTFFRNLSADTVRQFQACEGLFIVEIVKFGENIDLRAELGL